MCLDTVWKSTLYLYFYLRVYLDRVWSYFILWDFMDTGSSNFNYHSDFVKPHAYVTEPSSVSHLAGVDG